MTSRGQFAFSVSLINLILIGQEMSKAVGTFQPLIKSRKDCSQPVLYCRRVHRVLLCADTGTSTTRGELPLWYNLRAKNNKGSHREGHTASFE